MIQMEHVNFTYNYAKSGALKDISLKIGQGECVLLCGGSGCGKTTVTRLLNGLIPHFYEGTFTGDVTVCGMHVQEEEIYHISRKVGSVFQNPRSQFFCLDTTSELAFGCENLGIPEKEIRRRIEAAVQALSLENLLDRDIFQLSGGEKQQIACGCVSAMLPDVFVLDEPTSNLDAAAIERLKQTLLFWKKQGKTIVIAEHRLYWLKEVCDRVIYMENGTVEADMPMERFVQFSPEKMGHLGLRSMDAEKENFVKREESVSPGNGIRLKNYMFSYGSRPILQLGDFCIPGKEIVAITGKNGAGKTTFVRCLCGLEKKFRGTTVLQGREYRAKDMLKQCYLVMQDVNHQLFCESVEDEICLGAGAVSGEEKREVMEQLELLEYKDRHPMSLSGGQKQRVAIASAVLAKKELLIFDEPTSGLDYCHMVQTARLFTGLRAMGKSIFIITHDRELIRSCCTWEMVMEDTGAKLYRIGQNKEE